jgi:hypothetical protein
VSLAARAATGFAIALLALAIPSQLWAEAFLDLYLGKSFTQDSDIHIEQRPLANDYTFEGVAFHDNSFKDPPYYGLRAGYFFERHPWLGLGVEFFHFKTSADTSEVRPLRGTRNGSPVAGAVPVNSVVQRFAITHGVNYLTLDALFRYPLLPSPERFPHGRLQLYAGMGLGPVIAHPEMLRDCGAGCSRIRRDAVPDLQVPGSLRGVQVHPLGPECHRALGNRPRAGEHAPPRRRTHDSLPIALTRPGEIEPRHEASAAGAWAANINRLRGGGSSLRRGHERPSRARTLSRPPVARPRHSAPRLLAHHP